MQIENYHLQRGDVFFPPEVLLILRQDGREQIIRVHDDVHETVDDT